MRWGHGLVCDCPVARVRRDNKTCKCGLPVVALMAPDLVARMAEKAPQSITQTVERQPAPEMAG